MRKFELINKNETELMPTRATKESAGYDLRAAQDVVIPPLLFSRDTPILYSLDRETIREDNKKVVVMVPTGVTFKGEVGDMLYIQPRSGIATKDLLLIPNSPGLVDNDYYPNEIKAALINLSSNAIEIKKGERIAQAVILNYQTVSDEEEVATERTSGFGSTGK